MTMEHEKLHSDDTEKSPVGSATEDIKIPHEAMIILPVRNVVLFPGMVVPLTIGRKSSVAAVEVTNREERPIGIITQKDPNVDEPTSNDIYQIGCVATILR